MKLFLLIQYLFDENFMSNERELELLNRRDEILRETIDLTSNVVQSLEQQQKFAYDTKENLHNQNLLLSLANDKMRLMNQDLTSVVNEINEIDAQHGCLCCNSKKKKKIKQQIYSKPIINSSEKPLKTIKNMPIISELIDNNEQEKIIINELNQMKNQLTIFQNQIKIINKSFEEGDEIIHQLGNESNQYMHASSYFYVFINTKKLNIILVTTALNKAEQVLGRKFIVNQEQQVIPRERRQSE
jgi:hypothetical protein